MVAVGVSVGIKVFVGGIGSVEVGVADGRGVSVNAGVEDAVRVGMIKVMVGVKVGLLVPVSVIIGVESVGVHARVVGVLENENRSVAVIVGVSCPRTLMPFVIQRVINPSR